MAEVRLIASQHKYNWLKEHWFGGLVVIVVLLLIAYVVQFFWTHKKVADLPTYQLTTEAMMNRFMASQKLLQSQNKTVTVTKGERAHVALTQVWQQPAAQAKRNAVMLLTISNNQKPDIPKILAWVQRGGHVITFSQAALLIKPNSEKAIDNSRTTAYDSDNYQHDQYVLNENALLTYLGIENIRKTRAHDVLEQSLTKMPPSGVELPTKALIRLPLTEINNTPTTNTANSYVGTVLNTDNTTQLNTINFFSKYPQAKSIADYEWLQHNGHFNTVINPMNQVQSQAIIDAFNQHANDMTVSAGVIMDVSFGEGRLTIINNNQVFTNPNAEALNASVATHDGSIYPQNLTNWQMMTQKPNFPPDIAHGDNAYLLSYLLKQRQTIWLVPDIEVPSLPKLLWTQLKWGCVAFTLCLIMGLLALPKRFGPLRSYQTDRQTNFFHYFNHVGQYLWQADQAQALVTENRERLLEHIIARHPELMAHSNPQIFKSVEKNQVCQVLSKEVGISKSAVALALFEPWHTEKTFLQGSKQFAILNQYYR